MVYLTKNITLEELTTTRTKLSNDPSPEQTKKLFYLATFILQPIRDKWGPLVFTSGYRSPGVNRAVRGKETGQHPEAEAGDFVPNNHLCVVVYDWIVKESGIQYGEVILEIVGGKVWIHISLPRIGFPMESLVYEKGVYKPYSEWEKGVSA